MKFGIRKPNIKKSIKARTTGRAKRMIKKTINPLYGKKGIGYIKNPKKAIYNKIYHKTSISAADVFKKSNNFFYNVFIALPLFCAIEIYILLYYIYKFIFVGMVKLIKLIINVFRNKKEKTE